MIFETTTYDLETNGLKGTSVLSFTQISHLYSSSADLIGNHFLELSSDTRYYEREAGETMNFGALKVNRLYDNVIEQKRRGVSYPKYFKDDLPNLLNMFSKEIIIGHNHISFDNSFMKTDELGFNKKAKMIDTMSLNRDIIKIPARNGRTLYKNPKLIEASEYYKVYTNDKDFHTSLDDTKMTFGIFKKMLENDEAKIILNDEIRGVETCKNSRQLFNNAEKFLIGNDTYFCHNDNIAGICENRNFVWNIDDFVKFSSRGVSSALFNFTRFTQEITSDFNRLHHCMLKGNTLTAYIDRININYSSILGDFKGVISYNSDDIFTYRASCDYFYKFLQEKFKNATIIDLSK